jgi:hypothetical protein
MASILAGLPAVDVRFVAFDTSIVDMSDKLADPVDLLLSVQLGGGTDIARAMTCTILIRRLVDLEQEGQCNNAEETWSYAWSPAVEASLIERAADGETCNRWAMTAGARHVAGEQGFGNEEIFDAIAGLVQKSLIATRIVQGEPQYRLLDTTRTYALGRLEEHGELHAISLRHAEYVIRQLESQREVLSALPGAERVAAYSWQLSNVRSALEWSFGPHGNDEIATRLAAASMQVFLEPSLLIECQAWAERAIARLGNPYQNARRAMEIFASLPLALMHTEGNDQRVRTAFSSALEIAVDQGDLAYELKISSGLFMYSHWTMDIRGATAIAVRSEKLALKTGIPTTSRWRKQCWPPRTICWETTSPHNYIAKRAFDTWRPVRAFEPNSIFFIIRASCSSAWHGLSCTEACSSSRWTMQGAPERKAKSQATPLRFADPWPWCFRSF